MTFTEHAVTFPCAGEQLLGIVAAPELPQATGVLIVVGGPQYRVGSHRQFLLLSRALAEAGYPAMRFDFRGMGDSTGELRDFEGVNEDIGAAINAFQAHCPQSRTHRALGAMRCRLGQSALLGSNKRCPSAWPGPAKSLGAF